MFSRIAFISLLALTTLAAAMPAVDKRWGQPTTTQPTATSEAPTTTTVTVTATTTATSIPASSCATGPLQCCNSVIYADSSEVTELLELLGIAWTGLPNTLAGLGCLATNDLGTCSAHTVCCEDNSHGGFISIGCIPISE